MKKRSTCRVEGCELPTRSPARSCMWHWLLRQPIEVQVVEMRARAEATPEDARLPRVPDYLWPPGWRWCASCSSFIPTFYAAGSRCYACNSLTAHEARIKREYDLTAEEYEALFELQGRACAVCRQKPKTIRLAVDHDHRTGQTLGLLCSKCNWEAKGGLHDSIHLARSLVHYLEHPPMSGEWTPPVVKPSAPARGSKSNPAETDPSYLMFDHEQTPEPLPGLLHAVVKRMTVDQLILSGGRSDPVTGTYWLAYREAGEESPPWEQTEAPAEVDLDAGASVPS